MARCRYRAQRLRDTDGTDPKRVLRDRSRAEDRENGGHFGKEAEKVPQIGRAGEMEGERPSKEMLQKFCLGFAETALPLMTREAKNEVENIT